MGLSDSLSCLLNPERSLVRVVTVNQNKVAVHKKTKQMLKTAKMLYNTEITENDN